MANFDFEMQHELKLTVVWKYPALTEEEELYRRNIELFIQEMAITVGITSEELSKPIVDEMIKRCEKLWDETNKPPRTPPVQGGNGDIL